MIYLALIICSDPGPFGDSGPTRCEVYFEIYNMILGNYQVDDIFGVNLTNYMYNGTCQNNTTNKNSTVVGNEVDTSYAAFIPYETSILHCLRYC